MSTVGHTGTPITPAVLPAPHDPAPRQAAELATACIAPSPTNPRKAFDKAALEELTASVRSHGVLQPVLVRPWPKDRKAPKGWLGPPAFELVAGERRHRAARAAGLSLIPALVRELNDTEVLEIQVIENLQREDLHPLEEAEGYERLLALGRDGGVGGGGGASVDELAAKVGRSKAYVYARLKLCALTPEARKLFLEGDLNPSTALLVARIPVPELQVEAAKKILEGDYQDGPMSVREASEFVQEHYMLRLGEAPWPVADAMLVPKAGPCTTCPKRTGNQAALFDDVKSADVCTDPKCFGSKKEAWRAQQLAAAAATGREIIAGAAAKKAKPHEYSDSLQGYVDLARHCYEDPKTRSYEQLLGKAIVAKAPLLEDPHTKELRPVMSPADVTKALKEKGYAWANARASKPTSSYTADQRKREARAKLEREVRRRIHEGVRQKVTGKLSREDLVLVATAFFADIWDENRKRILSLWGWENRGGSRDSGRAPIAGLEEADLRRLLVDLALVGQAHVSAFGSRSPTQLLEAAKRHGVDAAAIRREVLAERKAPPKSAKAAGGVAKRARKKKG
jgi:ParB/RepB/Spo0J family partition protein